MRNNNEKWEERYDRACERNWVVSEISDSLSLQWFKTKKDHMTRCYWSAVRGWKSALDSGKTPSIPETK